MTYRTSVLGASGYMGAELLRLLAGHPELELHLAMAGSHAGAEVRELYPGLRQTYGDRRFTAVDLEALRGDDVVFCALPHGESQQLMAELVDAVGHVVDLAADFRLPPELYRTWYGRDHVAPELLERFSFGLPELFRDDIAQRRHVAAPGCYPTAAALALAPALAAELVEPSGIVVNALSGVSGRGRSLSTPSLYSEASENAVAYGLLGHRHTGEMEHALTRASGTGVQVLFTPHLVPMTRGIVATVHARSRGRADDPARAYREFYADDPFVAVVEEPSGTKATLGSNTALVTVRADARTGGLLAIAVLDNLTKGGSGQAIQATNLLLGLPETTGLPAQGLVP